MLVRQLKIGASKTSLNILAVFSESATVPAQVLGNKKGSDRLPILEFYFSVCDLASSLTK